MTKILETIKTFCFWGLLFLLLLMIGFGVGVSDLWTEALSGNIHIRIISIFLLVSPILFVVLEILEFVSDMKDGIPFLDSIGTSLLPLFWPVYMIFRRKNFDGLAYVLVMTILWWGMIGYGVWTILSVEGNRIINKIMVFDSQRIWATIGIFVGICFVVFLIAFLLWVISGKRIRDLIGS